MMRTKAKHEKSEGFALVLSLGLMAFCLMLLLAVSAFIRVESSVAQTSRQTQEARQNALLGLQIALGNLQKYTGDDRRVTVTTDALNDDLSNRYGVVPAENRNWTAVYDSDTGGWLAYLLSGELQQSDAPLNYQVPIDAAGRLTSVDEVLLVGAGSIDLTEDLDGNGLPDDVVVAPKEAIMEADAKFGQYAWWVGDEGVKARINLDGNAPVNARVPAERSSLASSPRADIRVFPELEAFPLESESLSSVLALSDLVLLDSSFDPALSGRFHDLTVSSAGLFTNVRDGGFKRDLSLAFEMSDADFNASTHFASQEAIPFVNFQAAYVFSETMGDGAIVNGPTWHLLRNFYRQYQDVRYSDPLQPDKPIISPRVDGPAPIPYHADRNAGHLWNFDYRFNEDPMGMDTGELIEGYQILRVTDASLGPILTNVQYLFSLRVRPIDPARDNPPDGSSHTHALDIVWDPVVTVWNPYNVELEYAGLKLRTRRFPLRFDFQTSETARVVQKNGSDFELVDETDFDNVTMEMLTIGHSPGWVNDGMWFVVGNGGTLDRLGPGELRVYSLGNTSPVFYSDLENASGDKTSEIEAVSGWNYTGGIAIPTGITGSLSGGAEPEQSVSLRIEDTSGFWIQGFLLTDWSRRFSPPDADLTQQELWGISFPEKRSPSHWDPMEWVDAPLGAPASKFAFSFLASAPAGKHPFARFDCYLKPASDIEAVALAGFNHPRARTNESVKPNRRVYNYPSPAWTRRLESLTALPGAVAIGPGDRGYWGPDNASGETHVTIYEVPTAPLTSIGQMMHANVGMRGYDAMHPVGSSFASPYIPLDQKVGMTVNNKDAFHYPVYVPDFSYLMNEALWDGYFFSSISQQNSPVFQNTQTVEGVIRGLASQDTELMNQRIRFHSGDGESLDAEVARLVSDNQIRAGAYERVAASLFNQGAFNVNSTSVDAWAAVLSGLRNTLVAYYDVSSGQLAEDSSAGTAFGKFTLPNGANSDAWRGFSRLSDAQVRAFAGNIVEQVRLRGPFRSLAQFVNRSLETGANGLGGVLQNAIWATDTLNADPEFSDDSTAVSALDFLNWTHAEQPDGNPQKAAVGLSGYLTQADILLAIGNSLSVRSDTFRVRAYGESLDPVTGESRAEAWLEAIVQRVPEPVERSSLDPDSLGYFEPADGSLFGRRYKIVHIKWLDQDRI